MALRRIDVRALSAPNVLKQCCMTWSRFHTLAPRQRKRTTFDPLDEGEQSTLSVMMARGRTYRQISQRLGRDPMVIYKALDEKGLLPEDQKHILTTKRWSAQQDAALATYLIENPVPDKAEIAQHLGRSVDSITRRIFKIAREQNPNHDKPTPLVDLDLPLSESDQERLRARMLYLIDSLGKAEATDDELVRITSAKPTEQLADEILPLIPHRVRRILAAEAAPTMAALNAIEWESSNKAGVFAWVLNQRVPNPMHSSHYMHIGATTEPGWGLAAYKWHLQKTAWGSSTLKGAIYRRGLDKGHFIVLVALDDAAARPSAANMDLLTLARRVMVAWFGTQGYRTKKEFALCPWSAEPLPYGGLNYRNSFKESGHGKEPRKAVERTRRRSKEADDGWADMHGNEDDMQDGW